MKNHCLLNTKLGYSKNSFGVGNVLLTEVGYTLDLEFEYKKDNDHWIKLGTGMESKDQEKSLNLSSKVKYLFNDIGVDYLAKFSYVMDKEKIDNYDLKITLQFPVFCKTSPQIYYQKNYSNTDIKFESKENYSCTLRYHLE